MITFTVFAGDDGRYRMIVHRVTLDDAGQPFSTVDVTAEYRCEAMAVVDERDGVALAGFFFGRPAAAEDQGALLRG